MRKLLGAMAVGIGIVSILLTARYGWKQADEEIDRWIAAVMFGAISLCAFVFDALAVRLWFNGWRRTGGFIGVIAGLAFVVTFSNSLGGIVSRNDSVLAARQDVTDARAANRRELARLEKALGDLGKFTPTDAEAVAAAKRAADTATKIRENECELRRTVCKQREQEEATAATALATATTNKATTDRAKKLELDIANVRAKMTTHTGETVGHANPLGNALALIIGSAADVLTARMQAIVALVFELCLVGLMVGFEALGHVAPATAPDAKSEAKQETKDALESTLPASIAAPPRPKLVAARKDPPAGPVAQIMTEALESAKGQRVELGAAYVAYAAACKRTGSVSLSPDQFADAMVGFCKATGIRTRIENDDKLYLISVQLKDAQHAQTARRTEVPA